MDAANLTGVDLRGADLRNAVLTRANLAGGELPPVSERTREFGDEEVSKVRHRRSLRQPDAVGILLAMTDGRYRACSIVLCPMHDGGALQTTGRCTPDLTGVSDSSVP